MKTLIIGGSGFLSSAVVAHLREEGHELTIFTRGQRPVPDGVAVIVGDRREYPAFVQRLHGSDFDAVVDCICYELEDAEADIRAFAGSNTRLVMISTDFVYGRERSVPMDEQTPRGALSSYGRKKVMCEEAFFAAAREGRLAATILRPPHIMGPGSQLGGGSLQGRDPMLLDRLRQAVPVLMLEGGTLLIQPVFHDDIARACAAVLRSPATAGQAYNCAGPSVVTTRRYYELIAQALGAELRILSLPAASYVAAYPEREPFAYHRVYDMSKMERDTGYRPRTEVTHAVFSMIDWLQANHADRPYEPTPEDAAALRLCADHEQAVTTALGGA